MKKEEVKKQDKQVQEVKQIKALVTSRVLFISALDKIYLVILLLTFIALTWNNFAGDVTSSSYGFWTRVGSEILIIICMFIFYLFLNWFYKCAVKTMLCLTKNEVYKEAYVPFKRTETSIPLNKITGVTTHNVFWIFRTLIIHQYGKLPMIFFTWNNQEFKDKLNELITTDKEKIENEYQDKNIITKDMYKYLMYLGVVLAGIICLIGVVKLFNFLFGIERRVASTYTLNENEIVLKGNGVCNIDDIKEDVINCNWTYDKEDKQVEVKYSYSYYSYYYGNTTKTGNLYLEYDSNNKTLTYNGDIYKK